VLAIALLSTCAILFLFYYKELFGKW
jgi:hypothetical protein